MAHPPPFGPRLVLGVMAAVEFVYALYCLARGRFRLRGWFNPIFIERREKPAAFWALFALLVAFSALLAYFSASYPKG